MREGGQEGYGGSEAVRQQSLWQAAKLLKPIEMADKERGECREGNEKRRGKKNNKKKMMR